MAGPATWRTVTVTAICMCGTTWRCDTTIRADLPTPDHGDRLRSCPICEPATPTEEGD